jgi:hypothetical protein
MTDSAGRLENPRVVVFPRKPTPGALGVVVPQDRVDELRQLEEERQLREWEVRGVVSDHIPLSGLGALTAQPQHRVFLSHSPLALWLHRGGDRAVYFDLVASNEERQLDHIAVKVRTRLPSNALLLAREPLNRLLDVLARGHGTTLLYQRLDLMSPRDGGVLAQELVLPPDPPGISFDYESGGGFQQSDAFAAYDAILREALTNPSPFYRLLCAFRIYEGTGWIRKWLRKEAQRLGVDVPLPADPRIDPGELEGMGLPDNLAAGVKKANELFEKFRQPRNAISHFLVQGDEGEGHVFLADGQAFQHYSIGATVLLKYARQAIDDLRLHYNRHISAHHEIGSVYPMLTHREQFIVLDPNEPKA